MKWLLPFLFCTSAFAEPIRVAVIDTGINNTDGIKLCKTGHKDFTGTGLKDIHGHGSNISHLIQRYAGKNANYCQIIIKYYSPNLNNGYTSLLALKYAASLKVDVINYSSGGLNSIPKEKRIISEILKSGKTMIVAAGNNGSNLDINCNYFPACYDKRLIVVGNGSTIKNRANTSNYGKVVDFWINGNNKRAGGYKLSGTSQSTAIMTGRYINNKTNTKRSPNSKAINKTLEAISKTKMGKEIGKNLKKHIPEILTKNGTILYFASHLFIKKEVKYIWEF